MRGQTEAPSETTMLATPILRPVSLLHDSTSPLSMFPLEKIRSLNPLSSTTKPKLSLKTSDLASTFHGTVSRQTSVNADATTATPTTMNTFNNTFDLTYRPSPVSAVPSPIPQMSRRPSTQLSSPITRLAEQPYHLGLPFGIRPILKNSPLSWDVRRPSISASPRVSGRRMFFPALKKVSFRSDLEEEVTTKDYVMRHTDLGSSEDESTGSSETDEQNGTSTEENEEVVKESIVRVDELSTRGIRKRKTTATFPFPAADLGPGSDEGSRSTSASRSKRKRRRWEWTLQRGTQTERASGEHEDHEGNSTRPATKESIDSGAAEGGGETEQPDIPH